MLIGYARVSTYDQKLDLQVDALIKAGCEPQWIHKEFVSGVKANREELGHCLKSLRQGDVLVVWKLDRLGRSLKELIKIIEFLEEHAIGFRSLTESIDTTSSYGKLFFHIFGAFAQFERDLISERTKAGLEAARKQGRRGGRKPKLTDEKAKKAKLVLENDPSLLHEEVARMFGVSRATLYRSWERIDAKEEAAKAEYDKPEDPVDEEALRIRLQHEKIMKDEI